MTFRRITPSLAAQVLLSLAALVLVALAALSPFSAACSALLHLLMEPFLVALEFLFRIFESNEGILAVSGAVVALALLRYPISALLSRLPSTPGAAADLLVFGFLSLLVLLAQAYLIAFALLAQQVYFVIVLHVGLISGFLVKRALSRSEQEGPAPEPAMADVPLLLIAGLLGAYFFLGMVQGHLATPVVYKLSATMAGLSADNPWLYKLVVVLLLALPLLTWLPRLRKRLQGRARQMALLAPLPILLCALLPPAAAVKGAGLLSAAGLAAALTAARFPLVSLAHPDPRRLLARLLFLSLMGANATAVHYLGTMWLCAGSQQPHPAVRRISSAAGAFSMASSRDGKLLLASLREPRQVIAVPLSGGSHHTAVDLMDAAGGTGHLFSWVEPENLLRLPGQDRFLLLKAVSDDQESNQVALLNKSGKELRTLDALRHAGVSDIALDSRGRVYFSTEFHGSIYVHDAQHLRRQQTIHWPEAETNKILITPDQGRIFSLGLWSDPFLRAMDISGQREVAALDVGTLSWDMVHDPVSRRIFVPKFISGQVLVVGVKERLEVEQRWDAGFGARTVDLDPALRLLYVGAMYDGTITVLSADSGEHRLQLRLGGHIKGLAVDRRTHKAYVGCDCGIYEIDGRLLTGE